MSLKRIYRGFLKSLESIPYGIDNIKFSLAEWRAIIVKYGLYKNIKWSKKEQQEFDEFWKNAYGKRIPNLWHRLYQASSGVYSVDYIPEYIYTTKIEPSMNDLHYSSVIEDKNFVELLSYNSSCVVPQTVVVCSNGRFYNAKRQFITKEIAIELVLQNEEMIFKPATDTSSGKGIKILHRVNVEEAEDLINNNVKEFIIQKIIVPHQQYSRLNPSSINTIRITTYILNGRVYHMPLCLRIGRAGSSVDNIHAGGLVIGLNDEGDLLPEGYQLGYGNSTKKYTQHPDTKIVFENYNLPFVKEVIKTAYELHGRYLHVGIISWDFTVNDKNEIVFIEANIRGQSIWICQMIHGRGAFEENTKDILKLLNGKEQ